MQDRDHLLLAERYTLICEDITSKIPKLLNMYRNLKEQDILDMVGYDPTGNKGEFVPWMARLVSKANLIFPEDGEKVKETLSKFIIQKKSPEFKGSKDIGSYKTYGDLAKAIEENEGKTSIRQATKIATEEGVQEVYTDQSFSVYKITTEEGAAKLCRNTKWCVKDPAYSKHYLQSGPLFMITKDKEPYVLMHFETKSIKDVFDRSIPKNIANEIQYIVEKFPQFQKIDFDAQLTKNDIESILDYAADPNAVEENIFTEKSGLMSVYGLNSDPQYYTKITLYDLLADHIHGLIEAYMEMTLEDPEENEFEGTPPTDFSIFSKSNKSQNQIKDIVDLGVRRVIERVQQD